jgi:hypothetical protein
MAGGGADGAGFVAVFFSSLAASTPASLRAKVSCVGVTSTSSTALAVVEVGVAVSAGSSATSVSGKM